MSNEITIDGKRYTYGTLSITGLKPVDVSKPPVEPPPGTTPGNPPPSSHNWITLPVDKMGLKGLKLAPGQSAYIRTSLPAGKTAIVTMASGDQQADCNLILTTDPVSIDTLYNTMQTLYAKSGTSWGGPCTYPIGAANPIAWARMSHATSGESVTITKCPAELYGMIRNEGAVVAVFNLGVTIQ